MVKGQTIISLPDWVARVAGLVIGYLFSSEITSMILYAINHLRSDIPTVFNLLSQWDSGIAVIISILLLISIISIVSKFRLLTFGYWLLAGALVGVTLPYILPYISDRIQEHG
ncbi:MAG: hypothetical protein DRN17_06775, partial [Thermoplasmata archaeon]